MAGSVSSKTVLVWAFLASIGVAMPAVAQEQCLIFPVNEGPEEVCVTFTFPDEPISVGPADGFALPSVEFVNNTNREMTFSIGGAGPATSPITFVIPIDEFVTLAPGASATLERVVVFKTDFAATIGTEDGVVIGWGVFGSAPDEEDYSATVEQAYDLLIGPDSDGDGLVDGWEINGYNPDGDEFIDVDLPRMGANPMHKDLFWEIDWMEGHEVGRHDIVAIKEAFAAAPIDAGGTVNPDGLPGINIWIDTGGLIDPNASEDGAGPGTCGDLRGNGDSDGMDGNDPDCVVGDNFGGGTLVPTRSIDNLSSDDNNNDEADFYEVKKKYFDSVRAAVFRYHLSAAPPTNSSGGWGEVGGNDSIEFAHDPGTRMHEFGHNLGLKHGGFTSDNCKTSYVSIMNYDHAGGIWQNGNFPGQDLDGTGILKRKIIDFAPPRFPGGRGGALPTLQEDDLDEPLIFDASDPANQTAFVNANGKKVRSALNTPNNYDGDSPPDPTDTNLMVNINTSDSVTGMPVDCTNTGLFPNPPGMTWYDDWTNISLPFNHFGNSLDGPINPVLTPEPTMAELLQLEKAFNTTDLAISKTAVPGQVEAGDDFGYLVNVSNEGPNPANVVEVVDILPAEVSLLSAPPSCTEAPVGTLTCALSDIVAGDSSQILLTVGTANACVNGVPAELTSEATVSNVTDMAGADPDLSDNAFSHSITLRDTTPPELSVELSPTTLWPPDHRLVSIAATVEASDICDPDPVVTLVSVTSNEADDGLGDGDTAGDIVVVNDFTLQLRAERSGRGNGRVYIVTYQVEDNSGNVAVAQATVTVPLNLRERIVP
jgi:uncharacterized repeat protein (TIGR01451 family)